MAVPSSALRPAPAQAERARPVAPRGGPVGVVDREQTRERARQRQARVLMFLAAVVVAGAFTIAAIGHAMLAATQVRADTLQSQLSGALDTQQNLRVEKATLETPTRVLALAESRFKMVSPGAVTYLEPVKVGPSVYTVHQLRLSSTTPSRRRTK